MATEEHCIDRDCWDCLGRDDASSEHREGECGSRPGDTNVDHNSQRSVIGDDMKTIPSH